VEVSKPVKTAEIVLEYQSLIPHPPVPKGALYDRACSNDKPTIDHWSEIWLKNIKANKEKFGSFKEHSAAKFYGDYRYQVAIIAGSGPSLKRNAADMSTRGKIPLVSCLHNFHMFEELDLAPEFYLSLDAGEVVVEEVYEGGSKDPEWYWERSKDRKLLCYIGTSPRLLEKWRGEVYFFNAPVPNPEFLKAQDEIEKFNFYFGNGGNVFGACLYFAKAILGCGSIIFTGADFSFGYPTIKDGKAHHKFHSWDSKYDKDLGRTDKVTDIYGNKVHTWPSYYNFKNYFDWVVCHLDGEWINSTEGGCMGAYSDGNIVQFKYMDLVDAIRRYNMFDELEESARNPEVDYRKVLY
jgi:hypothetical protein